MKRSLRDALGLLRLLYAAEDRVGDPAAHERVSLLLAAGEGLARALQHPQRATLAGAVAALEAVLDRGGLGQERHELVAIAADRVRGGPREHGEQVDPRKRARTMRG